MRHAAIAASLLARRDTAQAPTLAFQAEEITFDAPPEVPGALPAMTRYEAFALAQKLGIPNPQDLGHGLWAVTAVVGPALAERWLVGHNAANRDLTEGHAERIGDDMGEGRWWLHHQGIGFRADGQLQDGQHRLWAIIESGVSALLLVALNITDQARMAIDSGRGRKPEDVAKLTGIDVDRVDVAIARAAVRGLNKEHVSWSNQEALAVCQDHAEALAWVRPRLGHQAASVKAAVLRAWYHVDLDRLDDFCSIVMTGARRDGALDRRDGTALTLHRWLRQEIGTTRAPGRQGARSPETATRVYGKTCRAIEAFLAGEAFDKFPVPTREIYTLPQP